MADPDTDPEGSTDRYLDARKVGRGSMGEVQVVHDARLGRDVAVKTLRRDRDVVRRRFLRERRITAQLEHPSIVPVHDAGTHPDGRPFYTMKYVKGTELKRALLLADDLTARLALVPVFAAVCQAVAYAHSRGIIHRDLKPSNVMLGPFGEAVVVDWGLARSLDDPQDDDDSLDLGDTAETQLGRITGTPAYMAPEQARGEEADRRSDVYALGAVLYQILAGVPPHGRGPMEQVLARAARAEVPSLASLAPDAPGELVAIAERALAGAPDDRYPDAGALAADVNQWLAGLPVTAYRYSRWERLRRYVGRNWRWLLPTTLGVLGISAATAIGLVNVRQQRDRARANEEQALLARDTAEQALAEALADRARLAARIEDGLSARVLAAEALTHAPSPDARGVLASLWSSPTPRLLEVLSTEHPCRGLAFYEDDLICSGEDHTSRVRRDGSVVWKAEHAGRKVRTVDDTITVGGRSARRLDARTGATLEQDDAQLLTRFQGHTFTMDRHDVRRDGEVVLHSAGTLAELEVLGDELWLVAVSGRLWRYDEGTFVALEEPLSIVGLDLTADERWVAAAGTGVVIRPWEGGPWTSLPIESEVIQLALGPEVLLGAAVDQSVYVWELGTWERIGRLPDHGGPLASVARGPGNTWATAGGRHEIRLWERGNDVRQLYSGMQSHAVRKDGQGATWACSRDGRIWRTDDDHALQPMPHDVPGLLFHCTVLDRHLYGLFSKGTVLVVAPDGSTSRRQVDPNTNVVVALAGRLFHLRTDRPGLFTEDGSLFTSAHLFGEAEGRILAVDDDDLIGLHPDGTEAFRRPHHGWLPVGNVGDRLVTSSGDGGLRLEDMTDGANPLPLVGHTSTVTIATAVTVGGRPHLVTAGWGHRLLVWDPVTGELLARMDGHDARVLSLSWDGRFVWSTSFDDSVRLWDLSVIDQEPAALVEALRERTGMAVREGRVSFVGRDR